MMNRFLRLGGVAATLLLLTVGCKQGASSIGAAEASSTSRTAERGDSLDQDDHEHKSETHDKHPQSYRDAVIRLAALRDQMRDAFAAKKDEEAHGSLHAVGHVLEGLPALAAGHTPAMDAEVVQETTNELFDLFTKVDDKMHGAEGADYAEVASSIDAGVERLQKLVPAVEDAGATEQRHKSE